MSEKTPDPFFYSAYKKRAALARVALFLFFNASTSLARGAGLRTELRVVRFFLEMRARDEFPVDVHRVADDCGDDEPLIAVRFGETVEEFEDRCLVAVRHAVL